MDPAVVKANEMKLVATVTLNDDSVTEATIMFAFAGTYYISHIY